MRDSVKVLAGHVGQYVFISTISVYASNAEPNADETAATLPYTGKDPMAETLDTLRADMGLYGPLKAVSEAEASRQFGAETTVIRPGLIVGPGDETDRFTYWPVRLARGGDVAAPGDGTDPVQFIDARDLAEWTIRMAERRTFGTFNATGPATTLTMHAMLDGIAGAVGGRRRTHLGPRPSSSTTTTSRPGATCRSGSPARATPPASPAAASTARWPPASAPPTACAAAADTLAWFRQQPADRQAKLKAGLAPARRQSCWRRGRLRRAGRG